MKNQNTMHSILESFLVLLAGTIIGVGIYGCSKEGLKEEYISKPVSSEDRLYEQTKIAFASHRD